eukprot:g1227.t1
MFFKILYFGLSHDQGGVILLAPGSSAPEFFSGLIGALVPGSEGVGIGTVVGSAVFNQLIIVGGSILCTKTKSIKCQLYPTIRDTFFYLCTLGLLTGTLYNNAISWWEALLYIILYCIYIVFTLLIPKYLPTKYGGTSGTRSEEDAGNSESSRHGEVKPQSTEKPEIEMNCSSSTNHSSVKTYGKKEDSQERLTRGERRSNFINSLRTLSQSSQLDQTKSKNQEVLHYEQGSATKSNERLSQHDGYQRLLTKIMNLSSTILKKLAIYGRMPMSNNEERIHHIEQGEEKLDGATREEREESRLLTQSINMVESMIAQTMEDDNDSSIQHEHRDRLEEITYIQKEILALCKELVAKRKELFEKFPTYKERFYRVKSKEDNEEKSRLHVKDRYLHAAFADRLDALLTDINQGRDMTMGDAGKPNDAESDISLESLFAEKEFEGLDFKTRVMASIKPSRKFLRSQGAVLWGILLIFNTFRLPLQLAFYFTVPSVKQVDPRKAQCCGRRRKGSLDCLRLSVAVIAILIWLFVGMYFLIEWLTKFGCLVGLPNTLVGIIFGAVATSTPDAYMSFLVAMAGHGDMSVANAYGSNIFDILVAIGVPYFIQTLVRGQPAIISGTISTSSHLKEELKEKRLEKFRVVPKKSKFQALQLRKRCEVVRDCGDWLELMDSATNQFIYYNKHTRETQWVPPVEVSASNVEDLQRPFSCTWQHCLETFETAALLHEHRNKFHSWLCSACSIRNKIYSFPVCSECGNDLNEDGQKLEEEYKEKWGMSLYIESTTLESTASSRAASKKLKYKKQSANPLHRRKAKRAAARKAKSSVRNTITELKPLIKSDKMWIDARREYILKHIEEMMEVKASEGSNRFSFTVTTPRGEREERERRAKEKLERRTKEQLLSRARLRPIADDMRPSTYHGTRALLAKDDSITFTPFGKGGSPFKDNQKKIESNEKSNEESKNKSTKLSKQNLFETKLDKEKEKSKKLRKKDGRVEIDVASDNHQVLPEERRINVDRSSQETPLVIPGIVSSKGDGKTQGALDNMSERRRPLSASSKAKLEGRLRTLAVKSYKPMIRNGIGVRVFANGSIYRGELVDGEMHGKGEMKYENGDIYTGHWKHNVREGHGIIHFGDGKRFEGIFRNNRRQGHGVLSHPNGEHFQGSFENGEIRGIGVLRSANGDVYEGEFEKNLYHGKGTFKKANGDYFIGEVREGKANGEGQIVYMDGEKYQGGWKDDRREGYGVCLYPDGSKYIGFWRRGQYDGEGKLTLSSGQSYCGNFKFGKRHIKGKCTFANGDIYVGSWKDDEVEGKGTFISSSSANSYSGHFRQGKRHGLGTLRFSSGAQFSGWFHDGIIHGKGIFQYPNGDVYKGSFDFGKKHGKGIFEWANGNVYAGNFVYDKITGRGTMTYASGHHYKGEFLDNKKHGHGKMKYANGDSYEGFWRYDQRHCESPEKGTYRWDPGTPLEEEYTGEWDHDKRHGFGKYFYNNKSMYVGNWVNGKRQGEGVFKYSNGSQYNGSFLDDMRTGHGAYIGVDGVAYEGEFRDGYMDGEGTLIRPNGDKFVGKFQKDKRHGEGVLYYNDGNEYHGTWCLDRRKGKGTYVLQYGTKSPSKRTGTDDRPDAPTKGLPDDQRSKKMDDRARIKIAVFGY